MRALSLIIPLVLSLTACELAQPETAYDAHDGVYPVPSRLDGRVQTGAQGEQARPQVDEKPEPVWPRRFASGDTSFATFEPQIDSWKNDKLEARVAVEVFPPGATSPKYGVVSFEAPTQTDRARGVVTLGDLRVTRAHFPTAKDREASYLEALRGADLAESKTVSVDRLQHQVAYGASHDAVPSQSVKNDPPVILVSDRPQILVLVDGPPKVRDESGVRRVINTRALLVSERGSSYVWVGDRWFRAPAVEGPYAPARDVPPALDAVKGRLAATQKVDLYGDATERVRQGAKVSVATKPTELIETRGGAVYEKVPGTTLSWITNTESDVLRDDATGQVYVLLSGRWFRAPSLSGPWTFVSGKDMPATFRDIPRGHREARVLASLPSTPEAEEAVIAASVPQTATVDRGQTRLAVAYDGTPDFQPVEGTSAPLRYAVNTATPVIATADGMYYAVENGVWFVSASPDGPWTVATQVPDVVYSIPTSSPIHYITYVRIYGYSPEYAYVGYTPGYIGAVYTNGVVVFGTGYVYRPWIGSVWFGRPRYWQPAWAWHGPVVFAGGNVYRRWAPSVVHAPPSRVLVAPRVAAPRAMSPASPTVAQRPVFPASPSIAQPAPRIGAPSAAGRAGAPPPSFSSPSLSSAPIAPRIVAPSSPSFGPSYAPPSAPRSAPPVFRSDPGGAARASPPTFAPPSGGGVIRANPGGAVRSAPPTFAPPAGGFRGSSPGIRSGGGHGGRR